MTAPATVHGSITITQFGPDTVNPFDLAPDTGVWHPAAPALVDIDGDGDLDMFVVNENGGDVAFFRNVGTAAAPSFVAESQSFGIPATGTYDHYSFVDINGDGLIDALGVDGYGGDLHVGINTGTAAAAHFDFSVLAPDPYGWSRFGFRSVPTFADINGDSLVDAIVGTYRGGTFVMLNTGTAGAPEFGTPDAHPYGLPANIGYLATPAFADIDGDGDLDALYGGFSPYTYGPYGGTVYGSGNMFVAMNTGTKTAPSFGPLQMNPFGLTLIYPNNIFATTIPTFADIDGDGHPDLVVGDWYGNVHVFTNETRYLAPVDSDTGDGTYAAGAVITLTVKFSGAVIVDDTSGSPTLSLETGATDRDATYFGGSGTDTLTFKYTVQAGDNSSHLDIAGPSALVLNNATIRDAGGHNVDLTLAQPGGIGSLAANAGLVIDAEAPVASVDSVTAPGVGTVIVDSSENGIAYLVNTAVDVTDIASITSAPAGQWRAVQMVAGSDTPVAVTGLDDGDYKLYSIDAVGNLSSASTGTVTIDSAAPHGTVSVLEFLPYMFQPYGLTDVGYSANPVFVDVDGDGDYDAYVGNSGGHSTFFRNVGDATHPQFVESTTPGFTLPDFGATASSPAFADIDGDGLIDAVVGNSDGSLWVMINGGTATAPAFGSATGPNPYGLVGYYGCNDLTFADLNGDGKLDAVIGTPYSGIIVQLNTGTPGNPSFGPVQISPFGLNFYGGYWAHPTFIDIDGDGDLDAFIGTSNYGITALYTNIGSATNPQFAFTTGDPFDFSRNLGAQPTLVDLNGDGLPDTVVGNSNGTMKVQLGSMTFVAPVQAATADGTYGIGSTISLTVKFSQSVFVDTTDGTPSLQLALGSSGAATYSTGSGTDTLTFVYTVQAGDNSSDLDVDGSAALLLNNGTIRSASGHDALLTVAAAGQEGSLSSTANLVIDTTAPSGWVDTISVQDNSGTVDIESSEAGTAYLVKSDVIVFDITSITGAPDASWNSLAVPDGSTYQISLAGLDDGTYQVFVVDAVGNLSGPGSGLVTIDSTPPVATVTPAVVSHTGSVTVQSSETGTAVLVNTDSVFTDQSSLLALGHDSWTSVTISAADSDIPLSAAGLRDGTYKLYAFDDAGNLSAASTGTVTIDSTPPHGTIAGAGAAFFVSPVTNPFSLPALPDVLTTPTFADLDGDGDLDLVLGLQTGNVIGFTNIGTAHAPVFDPTPITLFTASANSFARPLFADIDGDGDLDAFVGAQSGNIRYFENTGSDTNPVFSTTGVDQPFGLPASGSFASPVLADLDGDGDLDAFVASGSSVDYFENTGDAHAPAFGPAVSDPFGFGPLSIAPSLSFVDIDGDGDLDAFVGSFYSATKFYRNIGTASAPVFDAPVTSPFNLTGYRYLGIAFADIDDDGDPDAFIGAGFGAGLRFFENFSSAEPVGSPSANGTYAAGAVITLTVHFSEAVYVHTGGGSPTLVLETGLVDEEAQYVGGSGTSTLTFTYTVQAGDNSPDLDAYALSLNGATIRDEAGNDALIAFAATGAAGSLSATHAIVVDTQAPVATIVVAGVVNSNTTTTARVQSTEKGTAYLVNVNVAVTDVASITAAADSDWNQLSIPAANATRLLSLSGLGDGAYKLYTVDAAGNLSAASTGTLVIDDTAPVATVPTVSVKNTGTVKVQGSETGVAYLVSSAVTVTDTASITSQPDALWNKANITAAGVDKVLSLAGLADGDYKLYVVDAAGNVSAPSSGTVTVDDLAPFVSVSTASIRSSGSASVVSTENGTVYLVNTNVLVTNLASITSAPNASWNKVAVTSGTTAQLSAGGLADGTYVAYAVDAAGNLSAASADAVTVDSTAPHVQAVYSLDANGTYRAGQTITLNIAFSEAVSVTGTPSLLLETGTVDHSATYVGSPTPNVLQFVYTVQAGDSSLDLEAIAIRGATFHDAAGNTAVLTLPSPGAIGSLSWSADIHVDGINDVLTGTPGADRLNGGVGADTMTGGDGNDIYYVDNTGDVVVETNADPLTGGIDTIVSTASSYTLSANVERGIIAANAAADITGNTLDNILTAGGGDNVIDGGAGIDQVSYGTAASGVTVSLNNIGPQITGGSGSDSLISIENLTGSAFADSLTGDAGANVINGGAGADEITGAGGSDILTGGADADTFVFDIASGTDRIRDFSVAQGDVISVARDANGSGIVDAAGALAHVHDVAGNAVLDLGGGNTVLLIGISTASLSAGNFAVFDPTGS